MPRPGTFGSPRYQINQIFETIKHFGESKHAAKAKVRADFESQNISNTWHNVGKNIGIYSFKTYDEYTKIAVELFKYVRSNFGVKEAVKITSEHAVSYLESKIADGIKFSTFQKTASAVEKLEVALNKYAQANNLNKVYKFDILYVRKEAQEVLERSQPTRAYENPKALVEAIKDPVYSVIALAQLKGGFRISELNHLSQKNFLDDNVYLVISGKGGLNREVPLPENVYKALKNLADHPNLENKKFEFNMDKYRNALKEAAIATNQAYTGSHGLRWNFAQNSFFALQKAGYGYEQTLKMVSELLGHHRADITKHYLKIA